MATHKAASNQAILADMFHHAVGKRSDQPMDSEQTTPESVLNAFTSSGDLSQSISPITSELIISAIKVNKYFGDKHVLKDVDFEAHKRVFNSIEKAMMVG
jgi:hypothetical protein